MELSEWAALLTQLSQLQSFYQRVDAHTTQLADLEFRMTSEETTTARLDAVTNNLANDVSTIRALVQQLRDAVTSGSQAAIDSAMARLAPHVDTLEQMENTLRGLPNEGPAPSGPPASASIASAPVEGQDVEAGVQTAEGQGNAGGAGE